MSCNAPTCPTCKLRCCLQHSDEIELMLDKAITPEGYVRHCCMFGHSYLVEDMTLGAYPVGGGLEEGKLSVIKKRSKKSFYEERQYPTPIRKIKLDGL